MDETLFKYKDIVCANLHDVVTIIKDLKSRDESQRFLKAFRDHIKARTGLDGGLQLSKFLQRHYKEDSARLHEFLEISFWEEHKRETVSTRDSLSKKMGRKRRGLSEDPRLVRPDESPLSGHETSSDPTQ